MKRLAILALSLLVAPFGVEARCVTAADLATGISFKRQDGHKGTVIQQGALVSIDYAVDAKVRMNRVVSLYGVYARQSISYPHDATVAGKGIVTTTARFSGTPPLPRAGKVWKTNVELTISDKSTTQNASGLASYPERFTFRPVHQVKLSGCTYNVMPVEATVATRDRTYTIGLAYFPDLGFALQTHVIFTPTGTVTGNPLTALTPGR